MFVVEVGAALTTVFLVRDIFRALEASGFPCKSPSGSGLPCCSRTSPKPWRKRAASQAEALRKTKTDVIAKRLGAGGKMEQVPGSLLRVGDVVVCDALDLIP